MISRRSTFVLRILAAGAAAGLLVGAGTARATDFTPSPSPKSAPSARPAAGPENTAAAGNRPVSGKNPQAGPAWTQVAGVWQVNTTETVLRNTVTDKDNDTANLTFEVYTTDAFGKPKAQVKLDNSQFGVLVSKFVPSGSVAEVKVEHGRLKPGVTYAFHTSAYDSTGLYETVWSPWVNFKIRSHAVGIKLGEPNKNAPPLNQDGHQHRQEIAPPTVRPVPPAEPPIGRSAADGWNCGEVNQKTNIQPCSRLVPDNSKKTRDALTKGTRAPLPHLVDWCAGLGGSHIKRYEACIGSFAFEYVGIVVKDGQPTGEVLNASWAVGQEVKLAGNSATFTQQLVLVPVAIDAKFISVTLDVRFDCMMPDRCTNGPHSWTGALEWLGANPFSHTAVGRIDHTWSAANQADLLDLSTKITAYSPVANPSASRWQADGAQIRCDKISSTTPGCTFYKYIPTWVMNFDKTPAAVAHAWLIQAKLPNHPGSQTHNKPMFFLPEAAKNAPGRDPNKNRDVICPKNPDGSSWASKHGNPAATPVPEISAGDKVSCDEFAYASSYNSGGMPGGVIGGMNPVTSGDQCVQTYATRVKQGEWHLYDDERQAAPKWNEVCGRSAMSSWINSTSMGGAFSAGFSGKYRLLDKDPYWVNFPQFAHCDASKATVACTVPKP
ncbi:hypothetical protein ABZ348_30295 [Streptomyces sp. NPDC005963]|uniref:hypothetical protein n=1 Tax=Streptomyces sp. NPDC005963 TaxID=3156721 RepID=UPI0033F644C9